MRDKLRWLFYTVETEPSFSGGVRSFYYARVWYAVFRLAVVVVLGICLLLCVTLGPGWYLERRACEGRAAAAGRDANYPSPLVGCQIQIEDGTYVPLDKWRVNKDD